MITARVAWTSTYTYILLFFVAAAFVAFVCRPRGRGEAVKRLYAGELISDASDSPAAAADNGECVHVHCMEGGKVLFERLGVENLTESGSVSLAVTFIGKDVEVVERIMPGYRDDAAVMGARFVIDMTGHEWRHIKWTNEDTGQWCAFSLHVRPGIDFCVHLKR